MRPAPRPKQRAVSPVVQLICAGFIALAGLFFGIGLGISGNNNNSNNVNNNNAASELQPVTTVYIQTTDDNNDSSSDNDDGSTSNNDTTPTLSTDAIAADTSDAADTIAIDLSTLDLSSPDLSSLDISSLIGDNSTTADSPDTVTIAPVITTQEPVIAVAQKVLPSVVAIETSYGSGTGIIWDAVEGYILTNHHVLQVGGTSSVNSDLVDGPVTVSLNDRTELSANVIGGSASHDVAVIQVDPSEAALIAADFAPDSSVQIGQLAVAMGDPFGLFGSVTAGVVSGLRTRSNPTSDITVKLIQTDAAINLGNSGGPLTNADGQVIGMNSWIMTDGLSQGNLGVGFAVRSDTVQLVANRVVSGESVASGYLGVVSRDILVEDGVVLSCVLPDSPADAAGLENGDIILAVNGLTVTDIGDLSATIKLFRPGDEVELLIERNGQTFLGTAFLTTLPPADTELPEECREP